MSRSKTDPYRLHQRGEPPPTAVPVFRDMGGLPSAEVAPVYVELAGTSWDASVHADCFLERSRTDLCVDGFVLGDGLARLQADPMVVRVVSRWEQDRPVLLSVTPDWDAEALKGAFEQTSRIGDVVGGFIKPGHAADVEAAAAVQFIFESRITSVSEVAETLPIAGARAPARGPRSEDGAHALIGIIDDGIDPLHDAFLDEDRQTRIVAIWDQRAPSDGKQSYGRVYTAQQIQSWMDDVEPPWWFNRDAMTHGTLVASIAAGSGGAGVSQGVAPAAQIAVVIAGIERLEGDARRTIGYSLSHVDALAWLDEQATALKLPLVVNLSRGMNGGAHDGRSALEAAIDAFSDSGRRPGRAIVKSAGNTGDKACHARVELTEQPVGFCWESRAQQPLETVEVWFDSMAELRFRLWSPDNHATPWLSVRQQVRHLFANETDAVMTYTKYARDNGRSQLIVTISQPGNGQWRLECERTKGTRPVVLDAWLELGGYAGRFVDHVSQMATLTVPGTATSVIVVGACDMAGTPASFSAHGPTLSNHQAPAVIAPGVEVRGAAAGTFDNDGSGDGTSFAAPHVTGAIALLMSKQHRNSSDAIPWSAQQIRAALQNSAGAPWDPHGGHGHLAVDELLAETD